MIYWDEKGNRILWDSIGVAAQKTRGAKIKTVYLDGDWSLLFDLEDGRTLEFRDNGQSCCEHRYMHCDDDLPSFVGAEILGADLGEPENLPSTGEEHEMQFLRVMTSRGAIVVSNHNEHNGYYGGFNLEARVWNQPKEK